MLSDHDLDIIEKDAAALRERMGVPADEKIDMVDMLRRMKFAKEVANVAYAPAASLRDSAAHYDPTLDTITVSEESVRRQNARDRFTYAHEVGHKVGNHAYLRHRKTGTQFGGQVAKDEEFANAFAAALLVPERLANVTEHTTIEEIVRRFGVSAPMAKLRLLELQRRFRTSNGIRRALPNTFEEAEFDSGDYDAAMGQMRNNALRWNAKGFVP